MDAGEFFVDREGVEPSFLVCRTSVFPLDEQPMVLRPTRRPLPPRDRRGTSRARKESNPLPRFWRPRCALRSDP
jgi:hypothetical protein